MGVAYCDYCGRSVDLDLNLEDYNFETKLCIECETGDTMESFEDQKKAHDAKGDLAAKKLMEQLYPIYHDMEQGSDEWLEVRRGKITASLILTIKF